MNVTTEGSQQGTNHCLHPGAEKEPVQFRDNWNNETKMNWYYKDGKRKE